MKKKDDGGAAFPTMPINGDKAKYAGMSLRDYFAAQALPSAVTAFMSSGSAWADYDDLAESVWNIADAMLKARAAEGSQR